MRAVAIVAGSGDGNSRDWSLAKRLGFRFAFCYLGIFFVDLFADSILFCRYLSGDGKTFPTPFTAPLWNRFVPWVGTHLFGLKVSVSMSGNDSLYDWMLIVTELLIALLATVIWSALDRKRRDYRMLHAWLRVAVRLMLASQMLLYGMDKVVPMQFGMLNLTKMAMPMGARTPFSVLWDFMAASTLYTVFAGSVEVVGGLLLLVPELTTLGASICTAAMTNVFVLNLAYDVPVKGRSLHLLLLSIFLLLPDLPRLTNIFVLHRTPEPAPEEALSRSAVVCRAARWVPLALGLAMLCWIGVFGWRMYAVHRAKTLRESAFRGIWVFDEMTVADPKRPLLTPKILQAFRNFDPANLPWKRVVLDTPEAAVIEMGDGAFDYVDVKQGPDKASMLFTDSIDPAWRCDLKVQRSTPQTMEIQGTVNGNAITAKLHRQHDLPLMTHQMRWVQTGDDM